jgi:hypothetical protein
MLGLRASRELPVTIVPLGGHSGKVLFGLAHEQMGEVEILLAESQSPLTIPEIREVHTWRLNKRIATVVVAIKTATGVQLFGPTSDREAVTVAVDTAKRVLQALLSDTNPMDARRSLISFYDTLDSSDMPGVKNKGLFASHHLRENLPSRSDWNELAAEGQRIAPKRKLELIESLGFRVKKEDRNTLILESGSGESRVLAVLLEETENFEAAGGRFFPSSPIAWGLSIAADHDIPWLIVLKKDRIRLHPGRDGVGVGQKGQAETYLELNLSQIDEEFLPLLPLVFSASALSKDGQVQKILDDSSNYAVDLGTRLRERVYEQVVPSISVAMAKRIQKDFALTAESLQTAYALTLRTLFRILFQAYAEDRGLLPAGRNQGFDENSLKTLAKKLMSVSESDFGQGTAIWESLTKVWQAIDQGNPEWNVPAYNGGLFGQDKELHPEGYILSQLSLTDTVMGPALQALLIDLTEEGVKGPVDFRSLSVREFGTIYEGLLESSLSLAEVDLTVDKSEAWVPAKDGEPILVDAGEPYFHSSSGDRKATGSYFTPKFVVDYLVKNAIDPTLDKHLTKIAGYMSAGDMATAGREFFDFRIADLAMGSAHFLVAAVDRIEAKMRAFLSRPENTVPAVVDEISRLKAAATSALNGDEIAIAEIEDPSLLRRQIARRCIYGVDINPMAVELSRLALWIHTFVPGLPMSTLDHNLVCANALTGIGTVDEALTDLLPGEEPGFGDEGILDALNTASALLKDAANASEATKAEVIAAIELQREARAAAKGLSLLFDAAIAARVDLINPGLLYDFDSAIKAAGETSVQKTIQDLQPAHMPYLFPEVFMRANPGFDCLLGNPPWEKVKIEEHQWWGLRIPGLRGQPMAQRNATLAQFRASRPDLEIEYEKDKASVAVIRASLLKGPFPGLGSGGDPDLYQAFAWRNWDLLRVGGRLGVVLPRGAISGAGMSGWRLEVLNRGAFESVTVAANSNSWLFEGVDTRYTCALTLIAKESSQKVIFAGPVTNKNQLEIVSTLQVEVSRDEFLSWSDSAAFPVIPSTSAISIFQKLNSTEKLKDKVHLWDFVPFTELHANQDRAAFDVAGQPSASSIPIYKGSSFNIWAPEANAPFAYANKINILAYIQTKVVNSARLQRSAFHGRPTDLSSLSIHKPRIAIRQITNRTNNRTVIPCLIPPMVAVTHQACLLLNRAGTAREEAFLVGVISSMPLDWYARRIVEGNLSLDIIKNLPIPYLGIDTPQGNRVIHLAATLAAIDERYRDWANEIGVQVPGLIDDEAKTEMIAEIDALVCLLYQLEKSEVQEIFGTFQVGKSYNEHLQKVLTHFDNWKGK